MQHHKIILPKKDDSTPAKEYQLKADTELRITVDATERASISLASGKAEIFGREITLDQPAIVSNASVAVYAVNDSVVVVPIAFATML